MLVREAVQAFTNQDRKIRVLLEHVLFPEQIKFLKKENLWWVNGDNTDPLRPPQFSQSPVKVQGEEPQEEDLLFENPNRKVMSEEDESSEEESDEDEEESEDWQPSTGVIVMRVVHFFKLVSEVTIVFIGMSMNVLSWRVMAKEADLELNCYVDGVWVGL